MIGNQTYTHAKLQINSWCIYQGIELSDSVMFREFDISQKHRQKKEHSFLSPRDARVLALLVDVIHRPVTKQQYTAVHNTPSWQMA